MLILFENCSMYLKDMFIQKWQFGQYTLTCKPVESIRLKFRSSQNNFGALRQNSDVAFS